MSKDYSRTDLVTKFMCAECGSELTLNVDKSRCGANSAYVINTLIHVNPCVNCKEKYSKPARLIKEALKDLEVE